MHPTQAAACKRPVDAFLDAEWFKALSDPTRVALLGCLIKCGRGCTVGEVATCCSVDMSVVSRHLTILHRAQILEASKRGRTVTYTVRYAKLSEKLRGMASAVQECGPGDDCGEGCCG